jgi:hypothetical protein|tara:strand:- start:210 stop:386 length:177 start_codon:yes stop_codon:yes gene_type:complete
MDKRAILKQKIQAKKQERTKRDTLIKQKNKYEEKQQKDLAKEEKTIDIDGDMPSLEDY